MSNEEIIEGNKLIAEFMGYKEGFPHETDQFGYEQCVEGFEIPERKNYSFHTDDKDYHQFSITQLKFHSSWDWLMPAVEKIGVMRNIELKMSLGSLSIKRVGTPELLFTGSEFCIPTESGLSCWYMSVIEFLKWRNQQLL